MSDVVDGGSWTSEYAELLKMMAHKILNKDPENDISKAFRLFDRDPLDERVRRVPDDVDAKILNRGPKNKILKAIRLSARDPKDVRVRGVLEDDGAQYHQQGSEGRALAGIPALR